MERHTAKAASREHDPALVYLRTDSGTGQAPHTHLAIFDDEGNGRTTDAPDGHAHEIRGLDVQPAGGHTHRLGTERVTVDRAEHRRYRKLLRRPARPS